MSGVSLYYVYVYTDPRPGKRDCPLYVGKGTIKDPTQPFRKQYDRALTHWYSPHKCGNRWLGDTLEKIKRQGYPRPLRVHAVFLEEALAFACEMRLISEYGRRDLGLGTLLNASDGGEGQGNWPKESRKRQSRTMKKMLKRRWSQPGAREEQGRRTSKLWGDSDMSANLRRKMKEGAQRRCASPEWRAAHSARIKEYYRRKKESSVNAV